MTESTKCARCRPGSPCLSHTRLPFGTAWIDATDPFWSQHPDRRYHSTLPAHLDNPGYIVRGLTATDAATGAPRLVWSIRERGTLRRLANLAGLPFDQVPLAHLDWLSGQEWCNYGSLRTRLTRYLRHPAIQAELAAQFPDPDDDSHRPFFNGSEVPAGAVSCRIECPRADRWHGQQRHAEEVEPYERMTLQQAWEIAADFSILMDSATDPQELLELDFGQIKQALARVAPATAERIRSQYRSWRGMLRQTPLVSSTTALRADLLADALAEQPFA